MSEQQFWKDMEEVLRKHGVNIDCARDIDVHIKGIGWIGASTCIDADYCNKMAKEAEE